MPKSRPPYPPAFRRQMVELVRTGRGPTTGARWREPAGRRRVAREHHHRARQLAFKGGHG